MKKAIPKLSKPKKKQGGARPGAGRPATGRDPTFALRLSPERRAEIDAWAKECGISLSEAIRRLIDLGWDRRD